MLPMFLLVSPAASLEWGNLIEIDPRDGQDRPLHVIDFIVNHSVSKVDDFAQLLLKDHVAVEELHNKSENKKEFVRAVLKKWIRTVGVPAAPRTWKSLVKCMKSARLDQLGVQNIEDNVTVYQI